MQSRLKILLSETLFPFSAPPSHCFDGQKRDHSQSGVEDAERVSRRAQSTGRKKSAKNVFPPQTAPKISRKNLPRRINN